jgi:hypothetical protein
MPADSGGNGVSYQDIRLLVLNDPDIQKAMGNLNKISASPAAQELAWLRETEKALQSLQGGFLRVSHDRRLALTSAMSSRGRLTRAASSAFGKAAVTGL